MNLGSVTASVPDTAVPETLAWAAHAGNGGGGTPDRVRRCLEIARDTLRPLVGPRP